jgi:transposase InsO family protein
MPWKEATRMSQREELAMLARSQAISVAELSRRFGISRKTAYKWLARSAAGEGAADRSRRPHGSPTRTSASIEQAILSVRHDHPAWGARKIAHVLSRRGQTALPAVSTITEILRRHGLITPQATAAATHWQRFEHPAPNDLWQMDFKGTVPVGQRPCDPLTVLDDHSRFNLLLQATPDKTGKTVQKALIAAFRRYGLPRRINMDNGSPWGIACGNSSDLSALAIWMIRVGIEVSFSAPHHPQTNGKDERFHRSLKAELLSRQSFASLRQMQSAFDAWRDIYNHVRPHQGIGMAVPADRYQPSPRAFPERLPSIHYLPGDRVVRVRQRGRLYYNGFQAQLSTALSNHDVALRPRPDTDGLYDVFFSHHHLTVIQLNKPR